MKNQAVNPFLPSFEYIPDCEPYVFNNRLYVFGSHDRFNGTQYCQNNYVCWSAAIDNLGDWQFEGVIYRKEQDPLCDDLDKRLLFAPDVQQGPDGRYYLYYAFDFLGVISVAVCDTPAGSYEFYGHVQYEDGTLLGKKADDPFQFDPGVLVEGDQVYLYTGFCPESFPAKMFGVPELKIEGGMVTELASDMLTVKKAPRAIFPDKAHGKGTDYEGHEFFEAPSMRKIGDTYYFVYSSFNGHELCYATSNYPDRDFQYRGTIISNADIYYQGRTDAQALNYSGNNHGGMVEVNGQWFIFYHRQTNRHQFSRQSCAEAITINPDGSIDQVEVTSCGLNNGPLIGHGKYEARIACNLMSREGAKRYEFGDVVEDYHPYLTQEGEDREDQPNQYIANLSEGAVAGFKYFEFEDAQEIEVEVRGEGIGKLLISTASGSDPIAQVEITSSKNWQSVTAPLKPIKGTFPLYFTYTGDGRIDFNSFNLS